MKTASQPVKATKMKTTRLEAFSDGVLAIIITIMVLELKVPHSVELAALRPMLPVLLSYVLSFIYLGIYWNNHHHLFQAAEQVSGGILWANLQDRKSTRLNSSHLVISYAVFCLKKKKQNTTRSH